MFEDFYTLVEGEGPLLAAALHDGNALREEVRSRLILPEPDRLREEDPFTAPWTEIVPTRITGRYSRFEVDLNRPREKAVYQVPADAWGLTLYREPLPPGVVERSLAAYDQFYANMHALFTRLNADHPFFVVLDLHSYNHRREGPEGPEADPQANPEVNIGTGTLPDRGHWAGVIDRFMQDLGSFDYAGRRLDVRENVRFQGGYFPRWIHENFPQAGCCIAVEFKKIFMDEWTGQPAPAQLERIQEALASTLPGLRETLSEMHHGG